MLVKTSALHLTLSLFAKDYVWCVRSVIYMNKARKRGDASSCLSDLRPNQHLWSNYKTKMIKNSLIVPLLAMNISSRRCQSGLGRSYAIII